MNGAGRWRCYLGWMSIHIVTMTSPITHSHLRQGTGAKRISTFSSPHTVSGSRVCKSIFKSCLLIQMTIPSDGTNFTQSIEFILYVHRSSNFFIGTHEHFAWICSGLWCSRTTVQNWCRECIWHSWWHAQHTGGHWRALEPAVIAPRGACGWVIIRTTFTPDCLSG
jgi:hypothetical protein